MNAEFRVTSWAIRLGVGLAKTDASAAEDLGYNI